LFRNLLVKTAMVFRRGVGPGTDPYNNPTEPETTSVSYPCWLEQTATVEITQGRSTVLSDWLLVLPPEAVVDPTDRVVVDGRSFEVVGQPLSAASPRGTHHIECRLRATVG
jgi:hypothetical protein